MYYKSFLRIWFEVLNLYRSRTLVPKVKSQPLIHHIFFEIPFTIKTVKIIINVNNIPKQSVGPTEIAALPKCKQKN